MTLTRQIWLLFRRRMIETLRQPIWLIQGISTPLLYLALFAPLLKPLASGPAFRTGNVLEVFLPGILVLLAFGAGTGAGWVVIAELDSGVVERFRVTPVSRFALLMGTVLRDVVMCVVPALLVAVIAIPFGFVPHWAGIALLLVLLSIVTAITSATSNALGLTLKEISSLAAIVVGLQLPLTLLSGVLLPLSLAPGWMTALAHVNPLYYAVEAARALARGSLVSGSVGKGFFVLGCLMIAVLCWSTTVYRRAVA